jgi:hypothetical protein
MNLYLIYISNKQQCRTKLQMNNKMITIDVVFMIVIGIKLTNMLL